MIVIIDCGMGNLGSIFNMLKKIGANAVISSNPAEIARASKLIMPGVGAFDNGMANLAALIPALDDKVLTQKTPFLGICLGMQLLTKSSEEGVASGLGWLNAVTVRFRFADDTAHLKVPHMGWNYLVPRRESKLLSGVGDDPRFYFVHSYHVVCNDPDDVLATTHYGYDFVSAVQRENIWGVQFHPEKSHRFGMAVLRNFADHA